MPLVPVLRRQSQADGFETSLVYSMSSRTARHTQRNPISKQTNKKPRLELDMTIDSSINKKPRLELDMAVDPSLQPQESLVVLRAIERQSLHLAAHNKSCSHSRVFPQTSDESCCFPGKPALKSW